MGRNEEHCYVIKGSRGISVMSLIRWIHLSDIHVRSASKRLARYNANVVLEALWDDIINRDKIDNILGHIDFAFISGDLAFSGEEYSAVFERIIKPLLKYGGLNIEQIFIVPGNHDIFQGAVNDKTRQIEMRLGGSVDEINKFFLEPVPAEKQKIFSRQKKFMKFIKDKFPHIALNEFGSYSRNIKTSDGLAEVRVIGLNSSWLAFGGDADRKKMSLGEPIVRKLYESESDHILTISLIHHPLKVNTDWFSDSDIRAKNHVIRNTDFILSGHIHSPELLQSMDLNGTCVEIVSGSIYENRDWDSNSYNYVVFDTATRSGACYLRRYDDKAGPGRFQTDLRSTWRDNSGKIPITIKESTATTLNNGELYSKFLDNQLADLRNRPLLSDFPDKEVISFLIPELYIDPHVKPQRNPDGSSTLLSEWLQNNFAKNKKILILGPPGMGKTTSLINICNVISNDFLRACDNIVPFFYEAREYNWTDALSFTDVLNFARSTYELDDDGAKRLASDASLSPFVLIDAIDEAFPGVDQKYESLDLKILNFKFPHIATCREDFFNRNLAKTGFTRQYDEILVIDEWQLDREATTFLTKYLSKIGTSDIASTMSEIKRYLVPSTPLNPLTITAFLFLYREEKDDLEARPITTYGELLSRFVNLWARREIDRSKCFRDAPKLLRAYEIAALLIYERGAGKFTFPELAKEVGHKMNIDYETLLKDRALSSILRFKRSRTSVYEGDNYVITFSHESIHELLIAQLIVKSLRNEIKDNNILSNLVGRTINQLVRDLLASYNHEDISHMAKELYKKYMTSVKERDSLLSAIINFGYKIMGRTTNTETKNKKAIIRRHNLCYFLGRIEEIHEVGYSIHLFQKLFIGEIRDHDIVMTAVGSSMLFMQNKEFEQLYIDRVSSGDHVDVCNRMYHLVYYGDASITSPDSFIKWECTSWSKTQEQIIKRLASAEKRHRELRSLDLVTFKRLSQTCGMSTLSTRDQEAILNCINDLSLSEEKTRIINDEHKKLIQQLGI